MTLNHLRYFVAIVDHRSLRKAADHVHVTQPALSNCIRKLEEHYGVPLLERGPGGVVTTNFGAALYEFCAAALLSMDRARREIEGLGSGRKGHVNVGATGGLIDTLVPQVIRKVSEVHPGFTYGVMFGFLDGLLDQLRAGHHDFLVTTYWPEANLTDELLITPLAEVDLGIYGRREHPLARSKRLGITQLASAQWIMPKSVGMNAFVRDLFGDNHMSTLQTEITTDNISFMVAMLKERDLLTIAPQFVVAKDVAAGSVVRLAYPQRRQKLSVGLISLRDRHLTAALKRFRDTAVALGPKLLVA